MFDRQANAPGQNQGHGFEGRAWWEADQHWYLAEIINFKVINGKLHAEITWDHGDTTDTMKDFAEQIMVMHHVKGPRKYQDDMSKKRNATQAGLPPAGRKKAVARVIPNDGERASKITARERMTDINYDEQSDEGEVVAGRV